MPYGKSHICADCKPVFLQRIREGATLPATLNYGSVGYRFLAILIDGIILAIANVAVGMILGAFSVARPPATDPLGVLFGTYNFANFLLGFLYQVAFIANRGATPGKMAMGLKVVTADGGPISYGRAIGRYFAQILDAFTLLIGYLIAFFDDERRTLHDRICGTRVITVR